MHCVFHIQLQPVVLPVRMEEHVMVYPTSPIVTVPVGTEDPTASTEVQQYTQQEDAYSNLH